MTWDRSGTLIGIADTPLHVRNPEGQRVQTQSGAFARSSLPVAGFALIVAAHFAKAIELVSRSLCFVASGVVEVWPLKET
jgi:hypothetical protein